MKPTAEQLAVLAMWSDALVDAARREGEDDIGKLAGRVHDMPAPCLAELWRQWLYLLVTYAPRDEHGRIPVVGVSAARAATITGWLTASQATARRDLPAVLRAWLAAHPARSERTPYFAGLAATLAHSLGDGVLPRHCHTVELLATIAADGRTDGGVTRGVMRVVAALWRGPAGAKVALDRYLPGGNQRRQAIVVLADMAVQLRVDHLAPSPVPDTDDPLSAVAARIIHHMLTGDATALEREIDAHASSTHDLGKLVLHLGDHVARRILADNAW